MTSVHSEQKYYYIVSELSYLCYDFDLQFISRLNGTKFAFNIEIKYYLRKNLKYYKKTKKLKEEKSIK